jgi:nicotinamidase-related amidase
MSAVVIFVSSWTFLASVQPFTGNFMSLITLDKKTTALILIDLQNGIVALPGLAPYAAAEVVQQCTRLADEFRQHAAAIVYVRVDLADFIQLTVDAPSRAPDAPPPPAVASELIAGSGFHSGDVLITKRHWSAFLGTALEQELRARGIQTIVLGGIATNFGVESTARDAAGLGFNVVFAEDAMTSLNADAHRFATTMVFPRIGRVRKVSDIQFAG